MKHYHIRMVTLILVCLSLAAPLWAGDVPMDAVYRCIKKIGTYEDLKGTRLGQGEELVKSSDATHAYIVKTVPISSTAQFVAIMGASREDELTDAQKGLLETYKFSGSNDVTKLKPMFPFEKGKITLELNDLTGFEDQEKYPYIRRDFWSRNVKVTSYWGTKATKMESTIKMASINHLGYGKKTPTEMKTTFAHEFGHSLDVTSFDDDAYGFDGSHYSNEIIGVRAAYAEGWANYIQMVMFPKEEKRIRRSLKSLRRETATGGYNFLSSDDPSITGPDFLRIEAVNALILMRLSKELRGGQEAVLEAFAKSNATDNSMARFLRTYLSLNPGSVAGVAKILDQETFGRLTDKDFRAILGDSYEVKAWMAKRSGTSPKPEVAVPPKPSRPAARHGQLYKWIDAQGRMNFSDTPPGEGIEYQVMGSTAEPVRVQRSPGSSNPFQ